MFDFIRDYIKREGFPPSMREIIEGTGILNPRPQLLELDAQGLLKYHWPGLVITDKGWAA
ncbi:hypothetical protein [Mycobacterium phage WXIN]|nr:hypothetical protein [Mycobacterium phage WXIN]